MSAPIQEIRSASASVLERFSRRLLPFWRQRHWPCALGLAVSGLAGVDVSLLHSAWPASTPFQQGEDAQAEAMRWIEALGAAEFDQREEAVRRLTAMGEAALPALEASSRHPNLEVRLRLIEVLSEIRRNDLRQRVERLLAGGTDGKELKLPCWDHWSETVGDSPATRSLYAEMVNVEWELLSAATNPDSQTWAPRLTSVFESLNLGGTEMRLPTYTTYLFLACRLESLDGSTVSGLSNFARQDQIRSAIAQGKNSETLKLLLDQFVLKMDRRSYATVAFQLAIEHGLPSGRTLAIEMLDRSAEYQESFLRYALMTLARVGTEEDLPTIERSFEDRRTLRVFLDNQQRDAELRDFALTAALLITGQSLDDYGVERLPAVPRDQWSIGINVGFRDAERREAAFAKWNEYRQKAAEESGNR